MNLLLSLSLCASAVAAVASASDQVLVLSAQKQLLHAASPASSSAAGFTSAGLAELAMDALGLATGNVAQSATVQNPVQADIFQHADAYALVFVQDDGALLDSIAADTTFTDASYHNVFPLNHRHGAAQKVPDVIANEFTGAFGASGGAVKCAGSTAICSATMLQDTVAADDARVEKVLAENRFLHKDVAEDARFAQELAQVSQLTASLSSSNAVAQSFYVVGFSDVQELDSSKRSDASKALAVQVSEFLSALQKTHAASGAQVVAARESAPSAKQSKAMKQLKDVTSYSRLLINLATEPSDSGSSDDDDDDDDDDSGSSSEESGDEDDGAAANATSSSNSTSEKVSMEEIAEYQIVLWTSVLLGVTLLLAILSMCNMNTGRDSLLYAKFITDAGHRKGD